MSRCAENVTNKLFNSMNLNYDIGTLSTILSGDLIGDAEAKVNEIIIDSRNFFGNNKCLFVAIKGPHFDGHQFISSLASNGCKNFIIEKSQQHLAPPNTNVILVDQTLLALQILAAHHRKQFSYPVIGITGSNGKTIVKEWLYFFLKSKYNIIRSPKSFNSQVGVPLSILQMSPQHHLAIIEAGISKRGEMELLEKIIQPDIGVLTHIGTAHSQNFSSQEEIKKEKSILFKDAKWVYSFLDSGTIIQSIAKKNNHTEISLIVKEGKINYSVPFTDNASIQNSITAVVVAMHLGLSAEEISNVSIQLPSIALRLETKEGINQNIIINDTYSNDLNSLEIALNYLSNHPQRAQKVVILSDMEQDFHDTKELYQLIAQMIENKQIDTLFGVGPSMIRHRHLFKKGDFFERSDALLAYLKINPVSNSIILIKGARKFAFEGVARFFELKSHETKLTIDLGALSRNVKQYKNSLRPGVKLLCMVKAFGYGSGSKEIGKVLNECDVDYLGVAYADEGEDLRKENIHLPIIVMNSEKDAYDKIIEHKLEPSIYSFRQLDAFIRTLIDLGLKSYPIHIKLDTGMKRLGFLEEHLDELISTLSSQPEVRVKSIFSHLAASDDAHEDLFTRRQIQLFQYMSHRLESGLGYQSIKHVLNTSGIERFPDDQLDMVRLGLGMYGVSVNQTKLETVGTLTTVISQIKPVKKGESIGYGRSQFADSDMKIGIIPIGYADGFSRILSNGKGSVWINGKIARVVGRVCMDMTIIDLTHIEAKEGDQVEIFGQNRPIMHLAEEMDTIPYEVMTSISHRVQRIYLD